MKKIVFLACVMFVMCSGVLAKSKNPVSIVSTSSSVLYLKFQKSMLGATIEVTDEKGNVVFSQVVNNKKVLIDFYYNEAGKYKVKIAKGDNLETFSYIIDEVGTPKQSADIAKNAGTMTGEAGKI
jgi:hypothetical protein